MAQSRDSSSWGELLLASAAAAGEHAADAGGSHSTARRPALPKLTPSFLLPSPKVSPDLFTSAVGVEGSDPGRLLSPTLYDPIADLGLLNDDDVLELTPMVNPVAGAAVTGAEADEEEHMSNEALRLVDELAPESATITTEDEHVRARGRRRSRPADVSDVQAAHARRPVTPPASCPAVTRRRRRTQQDARLGATTRDVGVAAAAFPFRGQTQAPAQPAHAAAGAGGARHGPSTVPGFVPFYSTGAMCVVQDKVETVAPTLGSILRDVQTTAAHASARRPPGEGDADASRLYQPLQDALLHAGLRAALGEIASLVETRGEESVDALYPRAHWSDEERHRLRHILREKFGAPHATAAAAAAASAAASAAAASSASGHEETSASGGTHKPSLEARGPQFTTGTETSAADAIPGVYYSPPLSSKTLYLLLFTADRALRKVSKYLILSGLAERAAREEAQLQRARADAAVAALNVAHAEIGRLRALRD